MQLAETGPEAASGLRWRLEKNEKVREREKRKQFRYISLDFEEGNLKMTTQAYYKDRLGFDPNDPREMTSLDPTLHGYEENLSKFKGI